MSEANSSARSKGNKDYTSKNGSTYTLQVVPDKSGGVLERIWLKNGERLAFAVYVSEENISTLVSQYEQKYETSKDAPFQISDLEEWLYDFNEPVKKPGRVVMFEYIGTKGHLRKSTLIDPNSEIPSKYISGNGTSGSKKIPTNTPKPKAEDPLAFLEQS